MQNTMRAHSAGQISIEGGVDVNKGHMVYSIMTLLTVCGTQQNESLPIVYSPYNGLVQQRRNDPGPA